MKIVSGLPFLIASFALVLTLIFPELSRAVPAKGHRIMVSGPSPYSVDIVREIQAAGGNAIDAAVAVDFELAVTHPYYASLGGGGLSVIKFKDKVYALDFRETAPKADNPDTYKNLGPRASLDGGTAVGVPGITAGLFELQHRFGKLKWPQVLAPAIKLAEQGFYVSGEWSEITARNFKRFDDDARAIFFEKDGKALKPGDRFKQPKLAKLLHLISKKGATAFYTGEVATDVMNSVDQHGGAFTLEDLKNYKPRWLEPIVADFNGYKVYLMPPPSSGGIVIAQALRLIEKTKLSEKAPLSVPELHGLIEVMKLSYRGRSKLGDPDFAKNPIDELRDEKTLDKLAALVKPDKAIDSLSLLDDEDRKALEDAKKEKEQTTNISVMDAEGNAVAMTVTLNGDYGSALITKKFGVALNNEMDDFTTHPGKPNMFGLLQGEANSVRAGARPLSSMSPTLVEKSGKTYMAVGAPGGPRIISAVLQVLYRTLMQSMDLDRAVQAPRVHHQFFPNKVWVDNGRLPPETIDALKAKGHVIDVGSTAKAYAVRLGEDGILEGAADNRGEGSAGGF